MHSGNTDVLRGRTSLINKVNQEAVVKFFLDFLKIHAVFWWSAMTLIYVEELNSVLVEFGNMLLSILKLLVLGLKLDLHRHGSRISYAECTWVCFDSYSSWPLVWPHLQFRCLTENATRLLFSNSQPSGFHCTIRSIYDHSFASITVFQFSTRILISSCSSLARDAHGACASCVGSLMR